jgi:transposase InsO family protein
MTTGLVEGFGWAYIVLVLAWYTKKIVGYDAGTPCTAWHWLTTLDVAVNRQFAHGSRGQGVSLMSDHGCQPTAIAFMEACSAVGIQQACIGYHTPPRAMRTLSGSYAPLNAECLWLRTWSTPFEHVKALEERITHENERYLHSALEYQPPSAV